MSWELRTGISPAALGCRRCQCDYCRKAAPRWWSDPAGMLAIDDPLGCLAAYRFGSKTADFLFCTRCGVLLAAYCLMDGQGHAVINLNTASGLDPATLAETTCHFEGEDLATRLARRRRNWTPAVVRSGTSGC